MSVVGMNPRTKYAVSEGQRFAADATLVVVSCASCGVVYAIPASFDRSAREWTGDRVDGRGWAICCPFGHTWHYVGGQTEAEKLRDRLASERDRAGRLASQRDQLEASLRGTRANAARTRKELKAVKSRVAAGVCPCCNRTFKQLAAHMKRQHPTYVKTS